MLEQILDFIHNYFVKKIYKGNFSISNGHLNVDFLVNNQYFKITGSIFNDGIYKFDIDTLQDETFTGEIWAMAVPPAVIALSNEIENWVEKYGNQVLSPYSSESFDGYSYTKRSSGNQSNTNDSAFNWTDVFKSRLNHWRKIS